jgi:hypothetical protein
VRERKKKHQEKEISKKKRGLVLKIVKIFLKQMTTRCFPFSYSLL